MLNRVDRRSQLKCLQACIEMLGAGASVLFFPEGTRSKDKVRRVDGLGLGAKSQKKTLNDWLRSIMAWILW
jgi:1-acyl-sn-glycerol-3-phosphate acyltransferase